LQEKFGAVFLAHPVYPLLLRSYKSTLAANTPVRHELFIHSFAVAQFMT